MSYTEAIEQLRAEGWFGNITLWHNASQATSYAELDIRDDDSNISAKPSEGELDDAYTRWQAAQVILDAQDAVQVGAKVQASSIPVWAGYTEAEALAYIDANVIDLASAIIVIKALTRMVIALRNERWPDLEGN